MVKNRVDINIFDIAYSTRHFVPFHTNLFFLSVIVYEISYHLIQDGKISSKNEGGDEEEDEDFKVDEIRPQPWYFHIVASFILVNSIFLYY